MPFLFHVFFAAVVVVLLPEPQYDGTVGLCFLADYLETGAVALELGLVILQLVFYAAHGRVMGNVLFDLEVYCLEQADLIRFIFDLPPNFNNLYVLRTIRVYYIKSGGAISKVRFD